MKKTRPPHRKKLIIAALAVCGLISLPVIWGFVIEPRFIEVVEVPIRIEGLGSSLDGTRIALIADLHHGPWTGVGFIERSAGIIDDLEPDILVLAGDVVHHCDSCATDALAPFASLSPQLGMYAVLGNHDHWEGAPVVAAALRDAGFMMLENTHHIVTRGQDGLAIAGVEELWEGTPAPDQALASIPPDMPRILVSHNPDIARTLGADPRIDLVLAGHSHGGQIRLPFIGPLILPNSRQFGAGLVHTDHFPVYVTRGLGEITPPVRFGCRPEITLITLTGR